ncbi:MAG: hypothetical protein HY654_10940 [Acidobacteria bacterium]|nr:hypothetical protein [Acidobacteriota bacterium]
MNALFLVASGFRLRGEAASARLAEALAEAVSRKIDRRVLPPKGGSHESIGAHVQVLSAAVAVILLAVPGAAQVVGDAPPAPAPTTGVFDYLTRYQFHLNAESILNGDRGFSWDADFGGEIDLIQYPKGRLTFVGNYEVVLGKEFRRFDTRQGNYILQGSFSRQTRHGELAGMFQHVSRHLFDRPKDFGIDWNVLGMQWSDVKEVRLPGPQRDRPWRLERHAMAGVTVTRAFVDYTWMLAGGATARRAINSRVSSFGATDLTLVGTKDPNPRRGVLKGFGLEGGAHLRGRAASVELFARVEHRIDAEMIERRSRSWLLLGFRFLSQ